MCFVCPFAHRVARTQQEHCIAIALLLVAVLSGSIQTGGHRSGCTLD
jgi:hypothetical protein